MEEEMDKQVTLDTGYGHELDLLIVKDGMLLVERLNNPPEGKALHYAGIKSLLQGKFAASQYDELATHCPELEEGMEIHSGFSFSVVLWAATNLLAGYSIDVNGEVFVLSE
jgi:hypothetical protein